MLITFCVHLSTWREEEKGDMKIMLILSKQKNGSCDYDNAFMLKSRSVPFYLQKPIRPCTSEQNTKY